MANFKEQVKKDIENVFQSFQEFGMTCSWNGQELKYNPDVRDIKQEYEAQGVNNDRLTIIINANDLIPRPVVAERVIFDDDYWYVVDVKPKLPFLAISIERSV